MAGKLSGWVAFILGLAMVAAGIFGSIPWRGTAPCAAPGSAEVLKDLAIYSPDTVLRLNGTICVGINQAQYFKKEEDGRAAKGKVLEEAEGRLTTARNAWLAAVAANPPVPADTKVKLESYQAVEKLRDEAKAAVDAIKTDPNLRLFVNGVPTPVKVRIDGAKKDWQWITVAVTSPGDAASDDAKVWRGLMSGGLSLGSTQVEVGLGGDSATAPRMIFKDRRTLEVSRPWIVVFIAIGMALFAFGMLRLGSGGGLLRDPPAAGMAAHEARFSLARVQLFWWFFIVLGGFLFIWLITGQYGNVITEEAATLAGIAGLATISARAIDAKETPDPAVPHDAVVKRSFLNDILFDGQGIGLHRVQMAVWTVLLGGITVWSVVWNLSFPTLGTQLLLLAGIMNGAYIGLKVSEKSPL